MNFFFFFLNTEGHLGTDGKFYLLDFARLFPPEAPPLDPKERAQYGRGIYYNMLRPEFNISYKSASLCSDTFSG